MSQRPSVYENCKTVLRALKLRTLTSREIRDSTGLRFGEVLDALAILRGMQCVKKHNGSWSLTANAHKYFRATGSKSPSAPSSNVVSPPQPETSVHGDNEGSCNVASLPGD